MTARRKSRAKPLTIIEVATPSDPCPSLFIRCGELAHEGRILVRHDSGEWIVKAFLPEPVGKPPARHAIARGQYLRTALAKLLKELKKAT